MKITKILFFITLFIIGPMIEVNGHCMPLPKVQTNSNNNDFIQNILDKDSSTYWSINKDNAAKTYPWWVELGFDEKSISGIHIDISSSDVETMDCYVQLWNGEYWIDAIMIPDKSTRSAVSHNFVDEKGNEIHIITDKIRVVFLASKEALININELRIIEGKLNGPGNANSKAKTDINNIKFQIPEIFKRKLKNTWSLLEDTSFYHFNKERYSSKHMSLRFWRDIFAVDKLYSKTFTNSLFAWKRIIRKKPIELPYTSGIVKNWSSGVYNIYAALSYAVAYEITKETDYKKRAQLYYNGLKVDYKKEGALQKLSDNSFWLPNIVHPGRNHDFFIINECMYGTIAVKRYAEIMNDSSAFNLFDKLVNGILLMSDKYISPNNLGYYAIKVKDLEKKNFQPVMKKEITNIYTLVHAGLYKELSRITKGSQSDRLYGYHKIFKQKYNDNFPMELKTGKNEITLVTEGNINWSGSIRFFLELSDSSFKVIPNFNRRKNYFKYKIQIVDKSNNSIIDSRIVNSRTFYEFSFADNVVRGSIHIINPTSPNRDAIFFMSDFSFDKQMGRKFKSDLSIDKQIDRIPNTGNFTYQSLYHPSDMPVIKSLDVEDDDNVLINFDERFVCDKYKITQINKKTNTKNEIYSSKPRINFSENRLLQFIEPSGNSKLKYKIIMDTKLFASKYYSKQGTKNPSKVYRLFSVNVPIGEFEVLPISNFIPKYTNEDLNRAGKILIGEIGITSKDDSFTKIFKIVSHLKKMKSDVPSKNANMLSPLQLYDEMIQKKGGGWCSQFERVYALFANAARIPTRSIRVWRREYGINMSGHGFNESYIEEQKRWAVVDLYGNTLIVRDDNGQVLNTIELQSRLQSNSISGLSVNKFRKGQIISMPFVEDKSVIKDHLSYRINQIQFKLKNGSFISYNPNMALNYHAAESQSADVKDEKKADLIKLLTNDLNSRSFKKREITASNLESMGWNPPDLDAKIKLLVAKRDCTGIVALGTDSVPALIEILDNQNTPAQNKLVLIKALGDIGDDRAIDSLKVKLSNWSLSSFAANALSKLKFKPKTKREQALFLIANNKGVDLSKLPWEKVGSVLIEDLEKVDPDSVESINAILSLIGIGNEKAIPHLIKILPKIDSKYLIATYLKSNNGDLSLAATNLINEQKMKKERFRKGYDVRWGNVTQ